MSFKIFTRHSNLLRYFLLVFFLFSIYCLTTPGHLTTSMDVTAYYTAMNLLGHGRLGFGEQVTHEVVQGTDGRYYSYEGLLVMLAPIPLAVLSSLLGVAKGMLTLLTNGLLTALAALLLLIVAREFGYSLKTSLVLALVYGLGTQAFVHAKYLMPDPLASLVFLLLFLYFVKYHKGGQRKWLVLTGIMCGAAIHVRLDSFLFILAIGIGLVVTARQRMKKGEKHSREMMLDIISFSLPILFFLAIFALYNYLRFGSILETGYTRIMEERSMESSGLLGRFDLKNMLSGLSGMWIVPNRSIFFVNPVLIISLFCVVRFWRKYRTYAAVLGLALLLYVLLYANRGPSGFSGSAAWGQRYLLPMTAFMVLPMGLFIEKMYQSRKHVMKAVFVGLFVVSVLFQVIGATVNYQSHQVRLEEKFGPEITRIFLTMAPRGSLLVLNVNGLVSTASGMTRQEYLAQLIDFEYVKRILKNDLPFWVVATGILLVGTALGTGYLLSKLIFPFSPGLQVATETAKKRKLDRHRRT